MSKNLQCLFGLNLKAEKKHQVFFLKKIYFEKNTNNLTGIKNYFLNGF